MDHSRAPVLEALQRYRRDGHVPFTPPGHKQGRGVDERVLEVLGADVFASDVLVMNGLDDRRMGGGVLAEAEELMADAVHAEHASFSTCGSSLSIKSCLLTVARPHQELLVARNAHKSVISGVILGGLWPVWVQPRWDERWQWSYSPGPREVRDALGRASAPAGMVLVTPTDYGTCADIAGVAEVCHGRGVPLIVDEAWGAHLPFHPDLPAWAMDAGADLCVTSVHKMGSGLEQSSVYHLRGDRVDPTLLGLRSDLLDTTSPSTLVYASLDGWRRQMAQQGRERLDVALELCRRARAALAELDGVAVVDRVDVVHPDRAHDHDPLKIVVDVAGLGISGFQAAHWLRERHRVDVGVSDHRRIGAQITVADSVGTVSRLLGAMTDLAGHAGELPAPAPVRVPAPGELETELAMLPRDAFFGDTERVPTRRAVGRVAAESVSPYPPGVPAVLPGEVVTEAVVDYLLSGVEAGMYLPDAGDGALETIRVVARG